MTSDTLTAPTGKMLAIFLGTLLFGNLLVGAIGYFFPNIEMPAPVGIVFLVVASMAAGGVFGTATKRRMTTAEKFRFAVLATILAIAITLALVWGMLAYLGEAFTLQNVIAFQTGEVVSNDEIMQFLPIFGGITVVVSLLVCFFGVGFGASNQLKQAARLAAKGK
jgi:uncharacterized membrane protein